MKMLLKIIAMALYCFAAVAGEVNVAGEAKYGDIFDCGYVRGGFMGAFVHLAQGNIVRINYWVRGTIAVTHSNVEHNAFEASPEELDKIVRGMPRLAETHSVEQVTILISRDIGSNYTIKDVADAIRHCFEGTILESVGRVDCQARIDLRIDERSNVVLLDAASQGTEEQQLMDEQRVLASRNRKVLLGKFFNKKTLIAGLTIAAVCGLYKWYSDKNKKPKIKEEQGDQQVDGTL